MSQEDEIRQSIRRVGAKDRKKRIDASGPLIPPEDADVPPQDVHLDNALVRDDIDPTAEIAAPQNKIYTPPDERYPPVAPKVLLDEDEAVTAPKKSYIMHNIVTVIFLLGTILVGSYFAFLWENYQSHLNPFAPSTPIPVVVTATPNGALPSPPVDVRAFSLRVLEIDHQSAAAGCNWHGLLVEAATEGGAVLRIQGGDIDTQIDFARDRLEIELGDTATRREYTLQLFASDGTPLSDPEKVDTRDTCAENMTIVRFTSRES